MLGALTLVVLIWLVLALVAELVLAAIAHRDAPVAPRPTDRDG
jgi:hypothetical protein